MTDLSAISGAALGRLYRRGEITPAEATEWCLDRIASASDPAIFLCTTPERARKEAAESTRRYREGAPLGPLDGVPVAWKDLFDIKDTITTAGSDIYRTAPPAKEDAAAVRMATRAGTVCVGKVNLSEFAYSGLGLNPHYGTPRNPRDTRNHRVPGGSSSGSAVAVAGGLVPCAIGTDTGGSVRIPAAINGIVGFKTAHDRIDGQGVFPLSKTLDTVGPLARTVEDCVLLECAMRGAPPESVKAASFPKVRCVVPTNVVLDGVEDAVLENFSRLVAELQRNGAAIVVKRIDVLDEVQAAMQAHGSIAAAEAYAFHKAIVDGPQSSRIDPRVLSRIRRGAAMSAQDLQALFDARSMLQQTVKEELGDALLLMPTVAHTAPLVEPLERDTELFHAVNLKTIRNTMIGSFLNLPGFALPSGVDAQGLPTSILISSLSGAEPMLFAASAAIEAMAEGSQ